MSRIDLEQLASRAGEVVDRVASSGEPAFVLHQGVPVAAVFPADHDAAVSWLVAHDPGMAEDLTGTDGGRDERQRRRKERLIGVEARDGEEDRLLDLVVELNVQDVHDGTSEGVHYFEAPFRKDARSVRVAFDAAGVPDVRVHVHDHWVSIEPDLHPSHAAVAEDDLLRALAAAVTQFYRVRLPRRSGTKSSGP
ncbi:MAG: hypothetical protein H0U89_09980 [Acidimicrobiia bacterium]|nr:hypothetical protein [Acidimicrobiia bacterium]